MIEWVGDFDRLNVRKAGAFLLRDCECLAAAQKRWAGTTPIVYQAGVVRGRRFGSFEWVGNDAGLWLCRFYAFLMRLQVAVDMEFLWNSHGVSMLVVCLRYTVDMLQL